MTTRLSYGLAPVLRYFRQSSPQSAYASAGRDERGIALITAMLIAAIVTAGAVAIAVNQQFDFRRVENILGADQVENGISTLEQQTMDVLREDAKTGGYVGLNGKWATSTLSTTVADYKVEGRLRDLQGLFNLTNLSQSPADGGGPASVAAAGSNASPAPPSSAVPPEAPSGLAPTRGATLSKAANGGVGPPAVVAPNAAQSQRAEQELRRLFQVLDIPPEPVQAILDWIDQDSDTRFPNGAEDSYYTGLKPAYRAANRSMRSIRELLLIKGITPESFHKLAPYVVCLPSTTQINVNTASKEILMSLSPGIDSSVADLLIKSRETQPFVSVSAFVGHPLVRFLTLATDDLTVTSSYFELKANARNERIDYRESVYLSVTSSKLRVLHRWREDFDE